MQTFISETLKSIGNKQSTFENTVFIVPSQRAGVFIKEEFKKLVAVGFLPTILNIEAFIEELVEATQRGEPRSSDGWWRAHASRDPW